MTEKVNIKRTFVRSRTPRKISAFAVRGGVGTVPAIPGGDLLRDFHRGRVLVDTAGLPDHGPDWDPFRICRGLSAQARNLEAATLSRVAA